MSAAAGGEHTEHGVGLDKVLATARAGRLGDPVEIVRPADAVSAYVVKQVQRSRPEKQDAVADDPATGAVTDVVRRADRPVLAELSRRGVDLHTGSLFGPPHQVALTLLAATLVLLVLWGYRMWWQRGRGPAFGRPIPRGAWRQVPSYILVPLPSVIAVLGYSVPLLGIPLAALLAVDVLLGEGRSRTGTDAVTGRRWQSRGPVPVFLREEPGTGPHDCRPTVLYAWSNSPASAAAIRRWDSASSFRPCRSRVRPSISRA